ncbi:MAG: heavy-metal-associated domain-containing protein [Anaerolineales bacterium]
MVKKVFRVPDMHCPNCAMKIEGIEDVLPGVKRVVASYRRGEVVVVFDDTMLGEADIIAALKKVGYTAEAS